jgi:antitoxin component YwqK of YwqJK toxin-antitoxin module
MNSPAIRAIFFILFFCPLLALAQGDMNQSDAKGKQGKWVKKSPAGVVIYEGTFKDDKPTGLFKYYTDDGKLKAQMIFSDNGTVSRAKLYNPSGALMAQGKYVNEKKDSVWVYYADKGWKINEETYVNGKKNGKSKSFFEDASVSGEITWKDDVKHGPCLEFYGDNTPKLVATYVNGQFHGKATYYYPGKLISAEGNYKNGVKEGVWKHYLQNGMPECQLVYKDGKVIKSQVDNGRSELFYNNNIPKAVYTYKNSKKNGPFVEYYEMGVWKIVTVPGQDGPDDKKQVLEGQQVMRKGNYLNDKLDGKVIYFTKTGEEEKVEEYKDGVLIK